jgi:LysM repeat protein
MCEVDMRIHRIKRNETVGEVAREYGVDEEILRMNNGLEGVEPVVGEELVVLTPTRTYTVARGDTAERLSLRFGVREGDLIAHNPWIRKNGLVPGKKIALRYGERSHGTAPSNAYVYRGCREEEISDAMPYLTYATFASAADDGRRTVETASCKRAVDAVKQAGRIPLVRIYDRAENRALRGTEMDKYIGRMIEHAMAGGYKGVVLGGDKGGKEYPAFLLEMRKRMIGCDLILVTEMSESSEGCANEYADATVLDCMPSDGYNERDTLAMLEDFATRLESSKTLVSLPTYAKGGDGYGEIRELLREARRRGGEIEVDGERGIACLSMRGKRWYYPSLESTKAILNAVGEYGYMGVSFDCMRVPRAHLATYNAMYKSNVAPRVSSVGKCNPED